jgi:hypothetical protein
VVGRTELGPVVVCRHPLAALANTVIGMDVSDEMLGARGSESAGEFVIARAERMPFLRCDVRCGHRRFGRLLVRP